MSSRTDPDVAQYPRILVDQVPSMLAYWDRDLRCRFANRAYERWFGVDPDALVGTTLPQLLGPQLFALNEPYVRAVLGGAEQVFERVVPGPHGVKRHSLATYVPDVVDGEVVGFIAHVTEVTKLKQAEAQLQQEVAQREAAIAQLRESRAALLEAQRLGGVGNWEWEVAPDRTTWSEGLYRIFGRDPAQAPPTFAEHPHLYEPSSWQRLQAAVARTLRTGEPYILELEYRRPDGQSGWLEARGEAVRGEDGGIVRLRGTVHEITLRHQMEDARVKAQSAEAGSRNKSELLSRVSHELRTPLNAILGFASLCEDDPALGPAHRKWAGTIAAAGRHMLGLVDEVLDLAAAESGRIHFELDDVALAPIVRECLVQASHAAEAGGIALRVASPDASAPRVRADRKRLKQVLDNLLSNAVKYTAPGGQVTVDWSDDGAQVDIAVRDSGRGLTEDQIQRMFQPFERLGAERTGIRGTGLGLALSKTLVELMGGSVRVESVPDVGSTFTVTLRKASVAAQDQAD